jgi:hypothetical protein
MRRGTGSKLRIGAGAGTVKIGTVGVLKACRCNGARSNVKTPG